MIWNLYKYLFFRLYSWNLKTWGNEDMPQFNAIIGVTFLMLINCAIIPALFEPVFKIKLFVTPTPKLLIILIFVAVFCFNYFLLVYKKKYLKIAKEFSIETKYQSRTRAILLWFYVIVSFGIFFIIGKL